jgi:CBS domain containing-hemolysin-like protein
MLLAASGFLSASETAFFSLGFIKIRAFRSHGGPREKRVAGMMTRPRQLIITIIIGNESVNIAASSFVGAYLIDIFGPKGMWLAIGLMACLLLIFCEIIPKTLAVTYSEKYALFSAPLLKALTVVTGSLHWVVSRLAGGFLPKPENKHQAETITGDEFRTLVEKGGEAGALDREEEEIIYNILELEEIPVSSLMIPRTELLALDVRTRTSRVLAELRDRPYSRIPVYENNIDNIVGVLYVKDLLTSRSRRRLQPNRPIGDFAKKPFIVPEGMKAGELFLEFRRQRTHLAVVVDEYGGTAGIITMDDLLNQLVEDASGDLSLERGLYQEISPGIYYVSGKMSLEEFNRLFSSRFSHQDINTIGGMLFHLFGRLPRRGEVLKSSNLRLRVVSVTENRIGEIRVERVKKGETP